MDFLNPLPNKKILYWSKLIARSLADYKVNENEVLKVGLERVENIWQLGDDAGFQHFLLFPQCFLRVVKSHFFVIQSSS